MEAEAPRDVVAHLAAARAGSSQDAEAVPATRVTEVVLQTRDMTQSGSAAAQQPTQDESLNQAATSSSAFVSSGGEHAKRLADPTVEGDVPM